VIYELGALLFTGLGLPSISRRSAWVEIVASDEPAQARPVQVGDETFELTINASPGL
jgi:hypothetical protein